MSDRESLAALLRERSISFGDFRLTSGQRSHYYIDARKTTMSAPGQVLIGRLGLDAIREVGWAPAGVGGLTLGADPVAYAIARASAEQPPTIDAFSVRKVPKQHGTGRRIEGNFSPGDHVVVVEDVLTTGGSALEAIETIRTEGGVVIGVLAIVDRGQGGTEAIETDGRCRVVVITTTTDLGL
ncbi:MAG TPA: orotate phosphoribosyltransferase [Gemmatimonadales bacterium]|nr:orotate phosphoribosyltransferase [Gemmatimonadales bacterium]